VTRKILIVDDDPAILALERRILERQGHKVYSAPDGSEAMSILARHSFDLLLLDVMMPGMDGFEVARSMERIPGEKAIPVVFVTAKDDSGSMREGFRSGGTVFLSKPFTSNQLIRLVEAMLGKPAR
jgi:two-component system sensor histidine kinase/response regulator